MIQMRSQIIIPSPEFFDPSGLSSLLMTSEVSMPILSNHLPPFSYLSAHLLSIYSSSSSSSSVSKISVRSLAPVPPSSDSLPEVRKGRTPRSCNVCTSRKEKCNSERPSCGRCVHLGVECVYQSGTPVELPPLEWHCPVYGCSLSVRSRDSLGKHVRRKHPFMNTTIILDLAKRNRHEAKVATAIDDDFHHYSSKPVDRKRVRRTIRDCDEYWPCMAPGCLKFFVSRHSLMNHRNREHACDDSVMPSHPSLKGTPHPMANRSLSSASISFQVSEDFRQFHTAPFRGCHAVPGLPNTQVFPSVLDTTDRNRGPNPIITFPLPRELGTLDHYPQPIFSSHPFLFFFLWELGVVITARS